ncbi:HEAT repeat containing protein [Coccidioides posadasii C735 delta SOWgp]|uniref:HEAT repeat containing protein n=1 Tax=Coccidioides posadasii (strain C735) TaxID=222929 RepID=C5P4F4_COCP7|nr:HEAT repeat containing protein [Coccidioides posadasii C735 delta SOWgp]EER27594.1 HEAT repeat containing protein [Coccidioides posadasii C735 delta SOWgp]|eukprot:XP_003069739.1 HEAT repeat containing protein [Coccidioides posadasii C735 delta SOWgp]
MPARAGTRASSVASTRKSSVPPSTTGANVFIPDEPAEPSTSPNLRPSVVEIFADAQRSTTGHRKLVVRLRKIQEGCCGLRSLKDKGRSGERRESGLFEGFGEKEKPAEREFNIEVSRCLLRVLSVKKTEGAADRVLKFLGAFLTATTEKDLQLFGQGDPDETQTLPETPSSRLTFHIVSTIIPFLATKEKTVRYRATQTITHIVNSLDSIDDELYHLIRQGLVKRIRDKEPAVRVQAVIGLGRLAGNDEDDDDNDPNDGNSALVDRLLDVLQNDTSAEVRRTLLLNLPLTPTTLPFLLERARDIDAATRRALYSKLLPTLGDFRHLSLSMREKLLRWGLRDRDETVRKATSRLFYERWIEDCTSTQKTEANTTDEKDKSPAPSIPALTELLERIDVVNSGVEGGIAHEAMRSFWGGRPDYREAVVFDSEFWESLTAETAFMARSFNDFCREEEDGRHDDLADEKIPEVTALAYYLHKYTTILLTRITNPEEAEGGEEETIEFEFIVEQLLQICLTLDYSDEVGRRKMFSLLRETLAVSNLPEHVTKLTVEALRSVCGLDPAAESEFCSVVLEAIAEVHDTIVSEDSFVSAKSEISDGSSRRGRSETPADSKEDEEEPFNKEEAKAKVLKEIMVNMKCLYIAQCMLQNVEGNLQDNVHLVTMLNNLVVPAVRSHEAPVRERGLECLGLCCLLDKNLAEENMGLFIHCYSKGHEALQEMALRILSDILTVHHSILLPVASQNDPNSVTPPPFQKPLLKAFAKALKTNSPPAVQATAVTSLAKLLLTNTLSPSGPSVPPSIKELHESSIDTLLQALVLSFFHPRTRDNLSLRQALTYFLPVYCHSRLNNAQHMRKIAVPVIRVVLAAADDFYALEAEEDSDGEIDDSVGEKEVKALMAGVIGMMVEWTDDRRIVGLNTEAPLPGTSIAPNPSLKPSESLHLALARDILQRVLGVGGFSAAPREERKLLLSMLGKLHIPAPPSAPSRPGSRAPEGPDEREILRSSSRSRKPDQEQGTIDDDGELLLEVKDLLNQAIASNVASDATGRNALVKVKNAVLKLLAACRPSDKHGVSEKERETSYIKEEPEDDSYLRGSRRNTSVISGRSSVAPSDLAAVEEEDEGDDTIIARRPDDRRSLASDAGTEVSVRSER